MGLVKKGWITQGEGYKAHQLIQEVIRYLFPPTEENCKTVIEGVADLLHIDESKDNPVDKFPFVGFGEAIVTHIKGEEWEEYGKILSGFWYNLALESIGSRPI